MVKKLGEICKFQSGGTPAKGNAEYFGGNIPWITTTALKGGMLNERDAVEWITEKAIKESAAKIVPAFSIMVGTRVGVGKVAINTVNMSTSQDIISLIDIDEDTWSKDFLCKLIQSKSNYLNSQARGATIKGIKIDVLSAIEVPIISLEKQQHISWIINSVKRVISFRENELQMLDDLIKARFVEMFGDPVSNPLNWEIRTVIEECGCMVPGRDKPKSFTGEIPWVTIEDLNINGVTESSKSGLGLTEEEINQVGRKTIPAGSVIMSCVGNLGICSIAGKEMVINQQLHSFQCGDNINNVFLMHYLGYRKDYMNKWASNTTVLYMNKTVCNSVPIMIPPMELQKEFVSFVAQVDKSKVVVKKALDETQLLFDSLMQQYFG